MAEQPVFFNPYATALDGLKLDDPVAAFFDFCKERENIRLKRAQGAKYLGFFSSRSLKMREKYISFAQLVSKLTIMWGFFDIIVNFTIQKLKKKQTSLKKEYKLRKTN